MTVAEPTTKIDFYRHDLGKAELDSIAEVFAGPILTTGEAVGRFERQFADYLGRGHALGVMSCTGAMHLSLLALGIGPGDEVITTPMTFIATSLAIIEAGATPVFVDVEPETGNLDAKRVEAAITEKTKAILPVHLYGQMCDMRALRAIADKHKLFIVEDAAHCIEGIRDGVRPGQLGDTACFSFYATKNLACGEGGAVVTDDAQLAAKLKLMRSHGMNKTAADRQREGYQHWDMPVFGWKYNMDNIHAAILLPQMKRLESKLRNRQQLARAYESSLAGLPNVRFAPIAGGTEQHARHLFPIWIGSGLRDKAAAGLQEANIPVMVNYRAIHLLTYFRETFGFERGAFPVAESLGDAELTLPFYPGMPEEHIGIVAGRLRDVLAEHA